MWKAAVPSTLLLGVMLAAALSGCGTTTSSFVRGQSPGEGDCVPETFAQFERGRPNKVVDGVGWFFGIPSRIGLWNWRVKNHHVTPQTEQQLQQYVAANGLYDVKVRINQYDPGGEWRRLVDNKQVAPGWRYTFGTVSALGYTLIPGRLFGRDQYNPFTNSIYVYSDVPSLGMQAAGYAKDVHNRTYRGTYAVGQLIPGLNMVHETIATRDVIDYVADRGDVADQQEAINVLYPHYGATAGDAVEAFVPASGLIELGGLLVGHATGRFRSSGLDNDVRVALPVDPRPPSNITPVGHEEPAATEP